MDTDEHGLKTEKKKAGETIGEFTWYYFDSRPGLVGLSQLTPVLSGVKFYDHGLHGLVNRETRKTYERKNMHKQPELNSDQKRVIDEISERLAESQKAHWRTERECLTKFTEVVGYDSTIDARQYVNELLEYDENGCQTFHCDKEDWSKSLTRVALRRVRERANDEIEARMDQLRLLNAHVIPALSRCGGEGASRTGDSGAHGVSRPT